jgi:hypothetical protein
MAGNLIRTLVVGGVASYVNETAKKKLARWGLSVEWHVEMGKGRQEANPSAPAHCEAIIVFGEMLSQRKYIDPWVDYARGRGILVAVLDRHESHWPKQFERFGFKTIPAVAAAAVAEPEEQDMAQPKPHQATQPTEFNERLAFVK